MERAASNDSQGLTLKRVLICAVITCVVVYLAGLSSGMRREAAKQNCFARFRSVNQALVLYRADSDGFSPVYELKEIIAPEVKLSKYDGGKSLACPNDPRYSAMTLRLNTKGTVYRASSPGPRPIKLYSTYGTDDGSVIATCENHLQHKFRFNIPGIQSSPYFNDPPTGGSYVALLRNGSAKFVPYNTKFQHWICRDGVIIRPEDRPKSWTGYSNLQLFDFEPSPPRFEQ